MKKLLSLLAIAAAALSGCTNEEMWIEESVQKDVETKVEQFTVSANDYTAADEQTRAAIKKDPNNSNVLKFAWKDGDAIGVFPESGMQMKFPIIEGKDSKTATFDGNGWNLKPGMKYAAYYPYDKTSLEHGTSGEEITVSYFGQMQAMNGSTQHLSSYDFMVAKSTLPNANSVNFNFKHVGAILNFELQIPAEKTFTKLSLVASEAAFTNTAKLNVFTGELIPSALSLKTSINLKQIKIPANGTLNVYMMIAAADLSGQELSILLEDTDGVEYQIEEIAGSNFQREKAYKYTTGTTEFSEISTALLLSGIKFNEAVKKAANSHNAAYNYLAYDKNVKKIVFDCNNQSTIDNSFYASDPSSATKIYLYYDNTEGIITLSTKAEKIILPSDASYLFSRLENLTEIENITCLNTSNVTDMRAMFSNDKSLTNIETSCFDTRNVTSFESMFNSCSSLTSLCLSNFDTSKASSFTNMFTECKNITNLDLSSFDTKSISFTSYMFENCKSLKSLNLSNFNTSNVTEMGSMFKGCSNLTDLDVSSFDTQKVISMGSMFKGCESLTSLSLSNFNTSKVTNMGNMFEGCTNLTSLDLSNFDTSKVTKMSHLFEGCTSLTSLDLSTFDTGNVTDMSYMFESCNNIQNIDLSNFDTSNVKLMNHMFDNCTSLKSLDIKKFTTDNVTNMSHLFSGCSTLKTISLNHFNTANVTDMSNMFSDCTGLAAVSLYYFNTTNVTDLSEMFKNCTSLRDINLTWFDTKNVTTMNSMFYNCNHLETLVLSHKFLINTGTVITDMMLNVGDITRCEISGAPQYVYDILVNDPRTNAGSNFE